MGSEGAVALLLKMSLLILLLLLLLDDTEELVTLSLGLLGKHDFALNELLSTGNVEVLGLLALELSLLALLSSSLALALLEGTLGAEGVDLTLTIGSTLLHLSQTLDLLLLLLTDASGLSRSLLFLLDAVSVVTYDFQILFALKTGLLRFAIKGDLV